MFKNLFLKKTKKLTVTKMQFDEYFIHIVNQDMTIQYAANYKHQTAIHVPLEQIRLNELQKIPKDGKRYISTHTNLQKSF